MTTAQVVETSVNVNNSSPIQDYVHPDDQTQPTLFVAGKYPFQFNSTQVYIRKELNYYLSLFLRFWTSRLSSSFASM